MKLTVLVDNYIMPNQNLIGEHGFSIYIEAENQKLLFDCGYSDVFIKNAASLKIDLLNLDYIVLSHGHDDHVWGLTQYLSFYSSATEDTKKTGKPVLVTHPQTFNKKYDGNMEIGCQHSPDELSSKLELKTSTQPLWLGEKLVFLGEIPRLNNFEASKPICKVCTNNLLEDDYVFEDSALVYKTNEGLIVITGCSHSGVCNIVEYAKSVCHDSRIRLIIGGLHLINPTEEVLTKTVNYLEQLQIKEIYPCHCTDFQSKIKLAQFLPVRETGVGLSIEITD